MKKKGDSEIISIVLLIVVVLILVGALLYFFFRSYGDKGYDLWLSNKLNNAGITVTSVDFNESDDQQLFIHFKSGPGMQELINESEHEVVYTFIYVNKTIKTITTPVIVTTNVSLNVSVVTVNDISGSMVANFGGNPGDKIGELKSASKPFIDSILNNSGNDFGLVAYSGSVLSSNCHSLSKDNESLIAKVDSWSAFGSTCICCGINKAIEFLQNSDNIRIMIVMSDGVANVCCPFRGGCSAGSDSVDAARVAYEDHNITVYTIGFGGDVDQSTMQAIANAGNGSYYFADISELEDVYEDLQQNFTTTFFVEENITEFIEVNETLYENVTIEVYAPKDVFYFKLIFYTKDGNTFVKKQNLSDLPGPLESKSIDISLDPSWGIKTSDLKRLEVYSAAVNKDGEEMLSSQPIAVWEPEGAYSFR